MSRSASSVVSAVLLLPVCQRAARQRPSCRLRTRERRVRMAQLLRRRGVCVQVGVGCGLAEGGVVACHVVDNAGFRRIWSCGSRSLKARGCCCAVAAKHVSCRGGAVSIWGRPTALACLHVSLRRDHPCPSTLNDYWLWACIILATNTDHPTNTNHVGYQYESQELQTQITGAEIRDR